jgi:hypothetical protein
MDSLMEGLDGILAACGIPVEKTAAAEPSGSQRHDFPGRENLTAKEPPAPLDLVSGVARSDLPEGVGRLDGNSSPVSPMVRALGGKTAAEILVSVRETARDAALKKLGFARPEQRFRPFGPSRAINDAVVMGFCIGALRAKTAAALPSTSLVARAATDLMAGRGPEAALASVGPTSAEALRNTLLALTGLGATMYGAKRTLVDLPLHVGRTRTEAAGYPFMERAPGTVSGFEAFAGGGSLRP